MSALYWVLVSDELMKSFDESLLPEGMRFTDHPPVQPLPAYAEGNPAPGASWRQVSDDNAGPEMEGRQVELILGREEPPAEDDDGKPGQAGRKRKPGRVVVIERRLL